MLITYCWLRWWRGVFRSNDLCTPSICLLLTSTLRLITIQHGGAMICVQPSTSEYRTEAQAKPIDCSSLYPTSYKNCRVEGQTLDQIVRVHYCFWQETFCIWMAIIDVNTSHHTSLTVRNMQNIFICMWK